MRKYGNHNWWTLLVAAAFFCCLYVGQAAGQVGQNAGKPATEIPDRIVLNVTADLSTSASVTWRTSSEIPAGAAQIAVADANPAFTETVRTLDAVTESLDFEDVKAHYHSVTFTDLRPHTTYVYRVGNGDHWSEWIQFKTAGKADDKLTFLYFGDVQARILPLWSQVVRRAYRMAPEARLALYAGDLVNRANRDVEWDEWFTAGGFIHSEIPVMPTPGNHDHGDTEAGEDLLSVFWRPQFTLPENGPAGLEESCYYIDVQGVRFISLNTERFDVSKADRKHQREWLEQVLASSPSKWNCVLMHHPVYSTKRNRDNKTLRKDLKPLFDKYRVDLVLQGHDHTYVRGMERIPMDRGQTSGTMYVVSVSGPKLSDVLPADWMERTAGHTQLFHIVEVDGDTLRFKTFTATGECYDAFELHKTAGEANRLVNQIPADVPERQ